MHVAGTMEVDTELFFMFVAVLCIHNKKAGLYNFSVFWFTRHPPVTWENEPYQSNS